MVGLGVVVEDLLLAWLGKLGRLWKSSWGAEEGRRISSPSTWGYRVHLIYSIAHNEYTSISVIEGTAPPASFKHLPTQPLPALSAVYSNYLTVFFRLQVFLRTWSLINREFVLWEGEGEGRVGAHS